MTQSTQISWKQQQPIGVFFASLSAFAALSELPSFLGPDCCDILYSSGFPLTYSRSGGIMGLTEFSRSALLFDILAAVSVSILLAYVCKRRLASRLKRDSEFPS